VKRGESNTNLPELLLLKFFAINLPSQSFLGRHLVFHFFFTMALLGAAYFFYSWAVFGLDDFLSELSTCDF